MDYSSTSFLVYIADGYSFRNLIGVIKNETDHFTMVLSPKKIEISFQNRYECGIHNIVLRTEELIPYHYDVRDGDGNLYPEYPISFDSNEFLNTIKGIGRKDGIRLYWLRGDSKINVQHMKTSTKEPGRAGASFAKIIPQEHRRYDVDSKFYDSEPTVRVQAKDFADICNQATSCKCDRLEIVGAPNGVTFKVMLSDGGMASFNKFVSQREMIKASAPAPDRNVIPAPTITANELDTIMRQYQLPNGLSNGLPTLSLNIVKKEDLMTIKVPLATVRALSKIHNISPPGTQLRFYFAEGKPVKIESSVGTYGTYIICLRNPRKQ